jgi:hypothetical protein
MDGPVRVPYLQESVMALAAKESRHDEKAAIKYVFPER